ncbi:28 kDa heat- and acid-stable phosphoprotein-like [Diadema setosum]|uniref:28 kDa heat- and acid-stable phosphoprotein-like n=1 Tax=Diadema setosum TaxID=31175 RepID=UPI003B3B89C0
MPKKGGGGRSKPQHKGRARKFTSPEEMAAQMKEDEEARKRGPRGDEDDAEEDESPQSRAGRLPPSDSEESSEEEEEESKGKGVEHLIEISNPNRKLQKMQKATNVDVNQGVQNLSRREREEIEKQQAKDRYLKAHAAGKTEEARADLARLAIIRKEREEAAKKRELEAKAKESQKAKGKK